MRGLAATVMTVFIVSSAFSAERTDQDNIRVFTNEDLEIYSTKPMVEPEAGGPEKDVSWKVRELDAETIFRENSGSVVAVAAYDRKGNLSVHGSGFLIRQDGAVVTSFHVIRDAAEVRIKAGARVFPVRGLLYSDRENDIAILKAEGTSFPAVALGDSESVSEGEKVYVMGNPQAERNTISEGISVGTKEVGNHRRMIQVTAPFSEGSSGGPVFNKFGEVIGIAAFVLRDAEPLKAGQPLNFAVPIDLIKDAVSVERVTEFGGIPAEDRTQTADYWLNLGNALNKSGEYEQAAGAYNKAVAIDPELAEALNGLSVVSIKLKRYNEAIDACKKALGIEPNSPWLYSNLGLAYFESGRDKEAIAALTRAIEIMPDLEAAHFNLGLAYRRLGMYKEAAEEFRNAVRISPDSAEAHFQLGIMYINLNDWDAAAAEHKILKDLNSALAERLSGMMRR